MATGKWFGLALAGQYGATAGNRVDWVGDTIKVALTTSTFTPNQDTHDFFNDVTNEVSGGGYAQVTLTGKSVTYDTTTNETRLISSLNPSWTSASFTARWAIIFKDTGTAATSPLLGYVDFGGDETVSSGTFTLTWDATGVLKITAA